MLRLSIFCKRPQINIDIAITTAQCPRSRNTCVGSQRRLPEPALRADMEGLMEDGGGQLLSNTGNVEWLLHMKKNCKSWIMGPI